MTTRLAYMGLLTGPVIVGFVARAAGLRVALALSLVGVLAIAACSRKVFRFER